MTTKIFNALERFIKARSGMDARDYCTDCAAEKDPETVTGVRV